ncbi:Caffeic acid O-methyltransferase [Heracleum sosnowskyi]|uniref:Caffeic acid O-methyltransferase n=1 Tax=Heracleum sosnowskyi TaxID=360622 RepID=A0AAD8IU35_9APIA|nr:Caffeic acid O-methyltransferase [Heracleum sosnowskyi]
MNSMADIKSTPSEAEEACLFALQLASASVLPMVLKAAIELDLLEIMAKAGTDAYLTPNELASMLPTSNPDAPLMLDRILRILASYLVLKCKLIEKPNGLLVRTYGLMPVCKFLTKNEHGVSMVPFSLLANDKIVMESWCYLKDAVLDGGLPFNKAFGMNIYDYNGTDHRFNKIFNQDMKEHSTIFMDKILENYNDDGKVVVAESILPEQPDTSLVTKSVLHLDAYMLMEIPGGRERTEKELETLAKRAGFKRFNKLCRAFNIWIMEFRK